ncbi:uncharacterized protein [Medicago truncatula]|uniref:uncharacterized protein n=1 Tax=Medicago truncatula TaxID=3880 RepID=UPI000D2F1DC4|nr:uncharacterized protein LOC112420116 [Medicago truncatula]
MVTAEQENNDLREELSNLKGEMEKMAIMMETMMAEREQAAISEPTPVVVVTVAPEGPPQPISINAAAVSLTQPLMTDFSSGNMTNMGNSGFRPFGPHGLFSTPQYSMHPGYPWGMPSATNEGFRPSSAEMPFALGQQTAPLFQKGQLIPRATMTQAEPTVHVEPHHEEQIYHSDSVMGDDRAVNWEERFGALEKEMSNMRIKEAVVRNVYDFFLVPDVDIPPKFKMPVFEKYQGDTCPQNHLTMYVTKMIAYKNNVPLLIHCFQDSLTGPAHTWFMGLKGITTFEQLADAFMQQYKYNTYLAPSRKELQSLTQKDKESFKEYAQRFIQKASQIRPPLDERELSEMFYETLNPCYSEKMIVCASQKFTDLVETGIRIEDWARKGTGASGSSSGSSAVSPSNGNKKFGSGYSKKNTQEVGLVAHGGSQSIYPNHHYIANITPQMTAPHNPNYQPPRPQGPSPYYPPLYQPPYNSQQFPQQPYYPQQPYQQRPRYPPQQQPRPQAPYNQQNQRQQFDPIPMTYEALLPSLLAQNRVQTIPPPRIPDPLPRWYRPDLHCVYHQGAPGHDVERCYALKKEVQKLLNSKELTFADPDHVAQDNPLPPHGPAVNMIQDCQGDACILYACDIKTPLVPIHVKMCEVALFSHDHEACHICSVDPRGCMQVQNDVQCLLDRKELVVTRESKSKSVCVVTPVFRAKRPLVINPNSAKPAGTPLVICVPRPAPPVSQKAVPYKYEDTILGPRSETTSSSVVDNIAESSQILRSGRVLPAVVQKSTSVPVKEPVKERNTGKDKAWEQPKEVGYEDSDEVLKLIKRSEYRVVDQLLQTPAKISIMSLLSSSGAHREALRKVLDQAFVDYDVTLGQFESIVGNVTACNSLSFSDEDLPAEGKKHNQALLISVLCKTDSLSNVLIDTGSALNVMPKSTLDQLTYSEALLRPSKVTVRAFDGTRRSVYGEIDLPISVGPHEFQVTFQVMEIQASFSCLLGRPWIHDAGAVTSTLHQKLKFVSHGKLITVSGESAFLISNLSAFSVIGGNSSDGSTFQGFSAEESVGKIETCMASLKDAQRVIQEGKTEGWGQLVELSENKHKQGIGFPNSKPGTFDPTRGSFYSAGFIHDSPETDSITEDTPEEVAPVFVTPEGACRNWIAVDIPSVIPRSKLNINEPVEHSNPMLPPNFEVPVYEALVEEDDEIPDEIKWMLEQERKTIQPHQEEIEIINLGTEEDKKEIKIGALLEESVKERVVELLREYADIFAWSYKDMPGLDPDVVEHRLPLKPECPPVKQKLRRSHPDMALKIKEEVRKQIDAGFLVTSEYPQWLANIVPVPKKDGKVRMCVDYRDLNKASPKDNFPLPHIDVLVDNTAKCKVFSFMDGFSGYNQIKMAPEDREKTSFITPWGAFCYLVMPFGLINAGATYQRGMTKIFHDMIHKEIEVYVDDMIVKSGTEEEHVEYLLKMFQRLRKYKLRLNPNKCTFGVRSGKLLGFIVSQKGIEVDPDKVRAIREMPVPKTEKQVRGFLGRLNYISRFISHMTATCGPIFKLLRKDQGVKWNVDCQKAFDQIQEYLLEPPILVPPVDGRPLIMYLTVLEDSMGCVLGQQDETGKKEHAIYYLSKKFTDCESRYSVLEKTCCALAWAAKRLRHYMINHTTWLISKMDPIKYIFEKPALTGRIARWQMLLSEYDIVYRTQKAIKGSILADHLAHQPIEDYQPIKFDFPDEEVMYLKAKDCDEPVFGEGPDPESEWGLIFDGAVNVYGSGIGAVLVTPKGTHIPFTARIRFDCTNNIAEYEACIMGIEEAIDLRIKKIVIYGDSALVINQIKGEWETRHPGLIPYRDYARRLLTFFNKVELHHVPRDENQMADALATLSSMIKVNGHNTVPVINVQFLDRPAYVFTAEAVDDDKPWYHDIQVFLQTQKYLHGASNKDKKTLRKLSSRFFLNENVLYKRNFDGVLLRCVNEHEAGELMHEIHEGSFGTHSCGHAMAKKILRAGYYWITMHADCYNHAKRCHKCQIYADKIHIPPSMLNVISSPWPFSMWGIDMIGRIEPKASNGHRFILVAIDYFTKWVEAASYANVTKQVVVRFIKNNIISRYGVPNRIITDNGTNLNNNMMKELCDDFKIQHHNSSPYRPQMNGAVEAANKNIKKIIQKMVVTYKDWHEMLPYALYGYRTSVRTSTGATPFSLVYGMEAVLPVEVEIPSLRVLMEAELSEAEWCQSRYDQLNLIEEKRMAALCHGQLYQSRMKQAFDKRVHPREFKEGDLVIKCIKSFQPDPRGKWTPNYEGPYVVKRAFSGGALILTNMDGEELPRPVNSDAVKKYFV